MNKVSNDQPLREAIDKLRIILDLPPYIESMLDEAMKASTELELAGYEGSAGFYYTKLLAVANGEQSIEPIYRMKKS